MFLDLHVAMMDQQIVSYSFINTNLESLFASINELSLASQETSFFLFETENF